MKRELRLYEEIHNEMYSIEEVFPSECTIEECRCEDDDGNKAYDLEPIHWYIEHNESIVFVYECNGNKWKETYKYQGKEYLN